MDRVGIEVGTLQVEGRLLEGRLEVVTLEREAL